MTDPCAAQITLEQNEYFLLRDVLGATGRLFDQVGPHDSDTWTLWHSLLGKVFAARRYEGASDAT